MVYLRSLRLYKDLQRSGAPGRGPWGAARALPGDRYTRVPRAPAHTPKPDAHARAAPPPTRTLAAQAGGQALGVAIEPPKRMLWLGDSYCLPLLAG